MHTRRKVVLSIAGSIGLAMASAMAMPAEPGRSINARMAGAITPVHDPAIIRAGKRFYVFSTGQAHDPTGLVPWRWSDDLIHWTYGGAVFPAIPAWASEAVPGTKGIWAPDISYSRGEYRLYYAASTFGKNRSAIGLATTPTLDPAAPGYGWEDKGLVFASDHADDYNAIDPNHAVDAEGRPWLVFGSFWGGLQLVALDPATGKPAAGVAPRTIARRPSPDAIEAPFIIRRSGFFYLFASFDFCCRGSDSTYYTVVGRSPEIAGPYIDREGRPMLEGGGTTILRADRSAGDRFVGPGHCAVLQDGARDYIVYHAYDTQADGAATLRIQPLAWSADGWPTAV